jgi:hypothetical protein
MNIALAQRLIAQFLLAVLLAVGSISCGPHANNGISPGAPNNGEPVAPPEKLKYSCVSFHYRTVPKEKVLEDKMKVAVEGVKVDWNTHWNGDGTRLAYQWKWDYEANDPYWGDRTGSTKGEATTERKAAEVWTSMVQGDLASCVKDTAAKAKINLVLVDRKHIQSKITGQDLGNAGITEITPAQDVKILAPDARIFAKISMDVKYETGTKATIQSILVHYWGHGNVGSHVGFGDRQKIRRTITFQADIQLVDAATGEVFVNHSSSWQPIDTKEPFILFGCDKNPIDFDQPDEQIARSLLQLEIRNFVARLMPMEQDVTVAVEASHNEECRLGLGKLDQGDYTGALEQFRAAMAKDAKDHKACFGAGIASEEAGDMDSAASFYQQAKVLAGKKAPPKYEDAIRRIEERRRAKSDQ